MVKSIQLLPMVGLKVLEQEMKSADLISSKDFKRRIEIICKDYKDEDLFNADKTALYYRALSLKSLVQKYEDSKSKKYCKEKLSILFAVSKKAEKLEPLVIGKKKSYLLLTLRVAIVIQNSQIQNFLPPNTASITQTLDQGIIRSFKGKYRAKLLEFLVSMNNFIQFDDSISIYQNKTEIGDLVKEVLCEQKNFMEIEEEVPQSEEEEFEDNSEFQTQNEIPL
ncbi:hypothetical protein ABPG72_021746 [Tetrahymena utriculariae]